MAFPTLLFEDHPNPMLMFNTESLQIVEVNRRALDKYGYDREAFLQLTIHDLSDPDDLLIQQKGFQEIVDTPETVELGIFRHQNRQGQTLYVHLSTQLLQEDNRTQRLVHINDVTETINLKKQIEEAYHDQQLHMHHNPLAMVKYDENLRIIEWSQRAEVKTGYGKDEVLGKSSFELGIFKDTEEPSIQKHLYRLAENGHDQARFETVMRLKDNSYMDVRVHASALRDAEGKLKSVLAFIENISKQKEYARTIEERERKYHRLFEDANDGIFLMKELIFIDCNQQVAEILQVPKNEIIGRSPLDFSPEMQPCGTSSAQKAREKVDLVKQGQPQVFEWKHSTPDGSNIDVEVSLNSIELGGEQYLQAIVRDLTEHQEIKNNLEAERKRLKRAQNLARMGWWSYEIQQDHVIWSDVLFEILEVNPDEFGGSFEDFYALVHPDDRPKLEEVMKQANQNEETLDYLLRIVTPNDNLIYAKCRARSRFSQDGEMIRMSGILQDITAQYKAEQELQRREKLFESLFVDAPVAIVMVDKEGLIQKMNDSFEQLFGYSEEELQGEDLLKYVLPENQYEETRDQYADIFIDGPSPTYYEDQRVTKKGELKHLFIGSLPVFIDGEPIAAFGIYTDITDLRETQDDLEESLREQEVLLAEIHHRVKNNLAIISGLLELEAMNWENNEAVNQVLVQSKLRIHSMAQIHEKLYQGGNFSNLNLENYISELVGTIYDSMQGQQKKVKLDIQCDNVYLNINQALPCALIINELVTNSFKYAFNDDNEGGTLSIRFFNRDDCIIIEVKDTGPGLPHDFEQMAKESLGHRLVRQLVKQLDGQISVESSEEIGTHYEIIFKKMKVSGSASNYLI